VYYFKNFAYEIIVMKPSSRRQIFFFFTLDEKKYSLHASVLHKKNQYPSEYTHI
jgi:hypothetical protein